MILLLALGKDDETYERLRTIAERKRVKFYAEGGRLHREAFHQKMEAAK